jgi:putative ABC transport system permease protein
MVVHKKVFNMSSNQSGWSIAWYTMNKWLQNFAYRIDLTIWPF